MAQETSESMPSASPNATPTRAPFPLSLYEIVDKSPDDIISWSQDGDSFFVWDSEGLARGVLGKYFKHENCSSFTRQLNLYGFHKVRHPQQGALYSDHKHEYQHFKHPRFRRNRQDLLGSVRKKNQRDPVQSPEVGDSSHPVSRTEIASAGDSSGNQSLETILLDVEALKRRQTELVTENKSLRDGVKTMQRQLQWMLRLLASWGLLSMTGPHWTMRGNNQLMIQGGPGKAEVEEATDFDTLTDSLSDHDTIPSAPSSPPFTVPGILTQAYPRGPNSPVSTDGAQSSPPSWSWGSVGDSYQSIGCPELASENNDASLLNSHVSGQPDQAHDFSEPFMDSLFPSGSLHHSSETNPYYSDVDNSKFVDFAVENMSSCNQSYGMGQNNVGSLYHIPSSLAGSGSDTQVTSCIPTDATVSVIRGKRKASMMYELESTGPKCTPHASSLSSSPYDTHPPATSISPPLLLPLNDQHMVPGNHLIFDPTFPPSGFEIDNRSPKRAKCTLESKGDNF